MWKTRYMALAMVWILAVGVAQGAEVKQFTGTWVMRLGERNLFVLTLTSDGNIVKGTFERPTKFSSTNSMFSNMRGGLRHDSVVRSRFADGVLYLTIQNANDAKDEDQYAMSIHGDCAEFRTTLSCRRPPRMFENMELVEEN